MSKHKWLTFACEMMPVKLAQALLARSFDSETGHGFRVISRSKEVISSTFIERIVTQEKIVDPFGVITELETVRYSSIKFRLHFRTSNDLQYLLEVNDPPRSIRSLIMELSDALDGVTVGEVTLPLIKIYSKISNQSPRARIVKLKASGIKISNSSEMRVEVNSSIDAYADFEAFFSKSVAKVEKIKIERPFFDLVGSLEIGANGSCSFDDEAEEHIRSLVLGIHWSF